jgi:hypothetical protein
MLLARRAQALAAAAERPYKAYYLSIANDWLSLATDMTKAMQEESRQRNIP